MGGHLSKMHPRGAGRSVMERMQAANDCRLGQ